MRVFFERSGGFAGRKLQASLDLRSLPPEDARRLEELLERSRFFELPLKLEPPGPAADRFTYRVTVESENGSRTVEAGEGAVPPGMRPLIDWLTRFGRGQR